CYMVLDCGYLDGVVAVVNLLTYRKMAEVAARTLRAAPGGREAQLAALGRMYLTFARTHRNRWSALFEHHPAGPVDPRVQKAEHLLFARIIEAAGIAPSDANKAEADSLRMLLAAVHGVVAFAVNRTIPPAEAERYVTLIVQAGVRGYREMVEEGLL
ncbi:MAG: TetR-like C-terminal domain-containing protein, partial [Pseudomonadota bacterium]